ncbi:hypothetical protein PYCC9005_004313 [Savitreella phatthalungensis]
MTSTPPQVSRPHNPASGRSSGSSGSPLGSRDSGMRSSAPHTSPDRFISNISRPSYHLRSPSSSSPTASPRETDRQHRSATTTPVPSPTRSRAPTTPPRTQPPPRSPFDASIAQALGIQTTSDVHRYTASANQQPPPTELASSPTALRLPEVPPWRVLAAVRISHPSLRLVDD